MSRRCIDWPGMAAPGTERHGDTRQRLQHQAVLQKTACSCKNRSGLDSARPFMTCRSSASPHSALRGWT